MSLAFVVILHNNLIDNKITDFKAIVTIIHAYEATPEKVIEKLRLEWG